MTAKGAVWRIGLAALLLALMGGCAGLNHNTPVVLNGQAVATIVIADEPSAVAVEAAGVLQKVVAQMTGQTLAIVPAAQVPSRGTLLGVGPSRLTGPHPFGVEQDRWSTDHYVVCREGRLVVLAGNDDGERQGTIYAVYDLLQRLGCGWFGPDPAWQVVPRVDTLEIPMLNVQETAAFDRRNIWRVPVNQPHGRAWRLGGQRLHTNGHVLDKLVPRRLEEQHPDWFHPGQPDICHPGVIEHVAGQFMALLDADDKFHTFSVGANDTHLWPDSVHTRAVGNPSAQALYFANAVAERLRVKYPNRFTISFYAYWVTQTPPRPLIKAAPEVCVIFVNESNKAKPWDHDPEPASMADFLKTQAWIRGNFQGWLATGTRLGIYDWWIPGFIYHEWRDLPWIAMETTVRTMRYWHQSGVRHVDIEADYERTRWPLIRWPLYYVGARALWDPTIDPDQVLREACDKLYGPAAPDLFGYYQVLERAMFETPDFQQNWNLPPPENVYTPEITAAATAHLTAAAARVGGDPAIAARIAQETELWKKALSVIASARETPRRFYRVYVDGVFMFWHQPETTVGTVRSLFGIPNHIPLYLAYPAGGVAAGPTGTPDPAVRYGDMVDAALDPADKLSLSNGAHLVTRH